MSSLINFEFRSLPAMRIIGKAICPKMDMQDNPIPAFWSKCFTDGTFKILTELPAEHVDKDYVGFMCDWDGKDTFTYICGMLLAAGTPVPAGFDFKDVPASTAAVGWIRGPEKENYQAAHTLTQQELEKKGYCSNSAAGWCMEYYNCPRFTQPQTNGDVILDYYIPCQPAAAMP